MKSLFAPASFHAEDPELHLARNEGAHLGWVLLAVLALFFWALIACHRLADQLKTIFRRRRREESLTSINLDQSHARYGRTQPRHRFAEYKGIVQCYSCKREFLLPADRSSVERHHLECPAVNPAPEFEI